MFAIAMILLTLAAVFGCLVLIAGCALLFLPKVRRLGIAILCGGLLGASAAFALFAFFVLLVEHGREPLLSQVAGVFSAAGFGAGGIGGAALFVLVRGLRLPNRWADRRRVGHAP
jgi:hypothetical protein